MRKSRVLYGMIRPSRHTQILPAGQANCNATPPLQQCVKRLQRAWLCGAMCLCDRSISQIRVAIRHHQCSLSSFTKVRSAHAEGTQLYEHFSGCPVSVYRRQSILFVLHSLLPACVSMLFCVCFMFLQTDQSSAAITSRVVNQQD